MAAGGIPREIIVLMPWTSAGAITASKAWEEIQTGRLTAMPVFIVLSGSGGIASRNACQQQNKESAELAADG